MVTATSSQFLLLYSYSLFLFLLLFYCVCDQIYVLYVLCVCSSISYVSLKVSTKHWVFIPTSSLFCEIFIKLYNIYKILCFSITVYVVFINNS